MFNVQCIGEEKWPRNILNFEVNGSFHWCCPKRKWFGNIRSDLDKLRLSTLAQDVVLNGEMQSNHPDMFHSPTFVVGEKKNNKLDRSIFI